jgi:Domain of unknown function (DUF4270)
MNLKFPIFAGILLTAFALFNTACKRPTTFGSELLDEEYADYDFTDTITVECTLVREDSVITSDRTNAAPYFLCGEINDPVVGKYSSDVYALMQAATLNPQFNSNHTLDSIVLYLNYAAAAVYGDTLQPQSLRVMRLNGILKNDSVYYSNASFPEGNELGRIDNFMPRPSKVDSLFDGNKGAFLRVKLDDNFGKEIMGLDSITWQSDTAFYRKFRGIKIVSNANGASPGAMLAFNLNNNVLSRMALYYRIQGDTIQKRFDFFFRNVTKFNHFSHDFTSSEAGPLIGQPLHDKLYVLGMQGLKVKVSFPYANKFDNIAVNKAQLVFSVEDNNMVLLPADQLVFSKFVGDTVFNFTNDVLYALGTTGNGSLKAFGGFPEKEYVNGNTLITRYRMAISEEFQHIVDDDAAPHIKNRTVYLSVYPRARVARRSVLHGPKSNTFPVKLELKYTRIK